MNDSDWKLILDYLDGTCSEEKSKDLEERLSREDDLHRLFGEVAKINEAPDREIPKPDVESALFAVARRLGIEDEISRKPKPNVRIARHSFRRRNVWPGKTTILRIAAVIVVAVGAALIFRQTMLSPFQEKVIVGTGQRFRLTLDDGTKVTLDSGSDFRYPRSFSQAQREVQLNGEALFEVTSDSDRPFTVSTQDGRITVLGTVFNVRAWREGDKMSVTVIEGSVTLESMSAQSTDSSVKIEAGQMSVLEANRPSTPLLVNVDEYTGWLQRKKHFKNTSLREVLDQLERWYGVSISLSEPSLNHERITVHLDNKPVNELIDLVCLICGLSSKQNGSSYLLSPI